MKKKTKSKDIFEDDIILKNLLEDRKVYLGLIVRYSSLITEFKHFVDNTDKKVISRLKELKEKSGKEK